MGIGLAMYLSDNEDTLFMYRQRNRDWTDGAAEGYPTYHFWNQMLHPYIKSWDVYLGPGRTGKFVNKNNGCDTYGGQNSYTLNRYAFNANKPPMTTSSISEVSNTALMMTGNYYNAIAKFSDRNCNYVIEGELAGDGGYNPTTDGYQDYWVHVAAAAEVVNPWGTSWNCDAEKAGMKANEALYGGRTQVVFADTHAKSMKTDQFLYDLQDNPTSSLWDPFKAGGVVR